MKKKRKNVELLLLGFKLPMSRRASLIELHTYQLPGWVKVLIIYVCTAGSSVSESHTSLLTKQNDPAVFDSIRYM